MMDIAFNLNACFHGPNNKMMRLALIQLVNCLGWATKAVLDYVGMQTYIGGAVLFSFKSV
jgi:hypothetical protein